MLNKKIMKEVIRELTSKAGKSKSLKKQAAARENGKLGGRPPKIKGKK